MKLFLTIILILHITGGFTALTTGFFAMLTRKGGKNHHLNGKFYFGGMTAVFISAIILSVAHHIPFLLMVGFFSYYMVVRGYRALYLKKLGQGQKAGLPDWGIVLVAGGFIVYLFCWGIIQAVGGNGFGYVAMVFGGLGCSFLAADIRLFLQGPKEKMHWWYSHIAGMGGGYIATMTAFIVVNVHLNPGWVLWLIPTAVGAPIIFTTIARYKRQFNKAGTKGLQA